MSKRSFFSELKRRKVYRAAVAYAVVSWLLIQIATQVFPFLEVPKWVIQVVIVLLLLGFPVALVLSWAFDWSFEGLKRTDDVASDLTDNSRLGAPGSAGTHRMPAIPEKSIAVLPFDNLSDNKENDYFAAGVHDDILSNLAKVADLKVISRTSVQQYKGGARNLRDVGQALGVAHILEGTARRAGNRVRINAQLIDARTDSHIWGEIFDREITDLFAVQSELAERITIALRANLSPREKISLHTHSTKDVVAYELFLRARELFRWAGSGDSGSNGPEALRLIDQAIARDPQFSLAHALASRVHSELYWFGDDKTTVRLELAKAAAETALRLRPDSGEAHLALAFYHYYGFRNYEAARKEIEIAAEATPNDAEVLNTAGAVDRRQGRWSDAVLNMQKARELDPRNLSVIWNMLETYFALHRYDEAEGIIAEALAISPNAHYFTLARGALDLFHKGDTAPLRSALRTIPADFNPAGTVTTIALRLSLMAHDYDEGARVLAASTHEKLNDNGLTGTAAMLDGYTVPKTWYAGLVARGRGDESAALAAFAAARLTVEHDLNECCVDAKTVAMLSLLHAELGDRDEAVQHARRAVELLPITRDAMDGPFIAICPAIVHARLNEPDLAIAELEKLMNLPNGPTSGTLRVEPEWDSLRDHPRFQKLLEPLS
ncbi:MAG: tetratricopeptide repeat protein [Verrucomicrobiota bacterium]